jgi:hypothetical protein
LIDGIRNCWRRRLWLRSALAQWRAEVDEEPFPEMEYVYLRYISDPRFKAPPQAEEDLTDTI